MIFMHVFRAALLLRRLLLFPLLVICCWKWQQDHGAFRCRQANLCRHAVHGRRQNWGPRRTRYRV